MPNTVNLYNGVDWDCPECGCENEIMYDSCKECDLEVEILRPHDRIKELEDGIKNVINQKEPKDSKWVMGYLEQLLKEK